MHRWIVYILSLMVLFLPLNVAIATELPNKQYFGVSASVTPGANGEYLVKTKGVKAEEGFVYTPDNINAGLETRFQIDLKGKGTIFLKIEETDARGTFIKESKSRAISLSEKWKTHQLTVNLDENTNQVDVFVLTTSKENVTFSFKNNKVTQK